jgi:hypothetical protein
VGREGSQPRLVKGAQGCASFIYHLGLTNREDTFLSSSILLIPGTVWRISLIKLGSSLHDFDMCETLVVCWNVTMHAMMFEVQMV